VYRSHLGSAGSLEVEGKSGLGQRVDLRNLKWRVFLGVLGLC
jgi:hypothetical protein